MRIIHTADLHINSPLDTHLSPERVRKRRAELIATFSRMAEEGVRLGVALFIIAGDLFDSRSPALSAAEAVLDVIERHPGIDFLYLPGNHERDALAECGLMLPKNLKIFDTGWTYFRYGELTVAGRRTLTPDMFDSLALEGSRLNIAVLHGSLAGRSSYETVGARDAADRGLDYLALGHYHAYSTAEIDRGCLAVYSGTPEGRGFDEAGERGFVLLDTEGGAIRHRFIPFAKRRLNLVRVDISGVGRRLALEERISEALAGIPAEDLVRVILTGRREAELRFDSETLAERWRSAFFHFELRDSSRIAISAEDCKYDKSLRGEFTRLCLERDGISEEERELIMRTGLAALSGEHTEI